jgi:hypothetical protein
MVRRLLILVIFILNINDIIGQLNQNDSLSIVNKFKPIKLTDSANSILNKSLQRNIINSLKEQGFDPNVYFILSNYKLLECNGNMCINLLSRRALSELIQEELSGQYKFGGLGEPGDDIIIIIDKNTLEVKKITNSE